MLLLSARVSILDEEIDDLAVCRLKPSGASQPRHQIRQPGWLAGWLARKQETFRILLRKCRKDLPGLATLSVVVVVVVVVVRKCFLGLQAALPFRAPFFLTANLSAQREQRETDKEAGRQAGRKELGKRVFFELL